MTSPTTAQTPRMIAADAVEGRLSWRAVIEAIRAGHRLPKAQVKDMLLKRRDDAILSRAAWIDGLGLGVKSMTVFPGNVPQGAPSIQGAMTVFDDATGAAAAVLDGVLVTNWKTAADSALGAELLARPDSARLAIVGAGVVAGNIAHAYRAALPSIERIDIVNRTPARAEALADRLRADGVPANAVEDLETAVRAADLVVGATMSVEPIIRGDWIAHGAHVDLIGAFRPDMREADDALLRRAELFVDSRDTTIDHIGELMIPIAAGVIDASDVRGDLYDLVSGAPGRSGRDAITLFKNGGGAHLDLMTARAILDAV